MLKVWNKSYTSKNPKTLEKQMLKDFWEDYYIRRPNRANLNQLKQLAKIRISDAPEYKVLRKAFNKSPEGLVCGLCVDTSAILYHHIIPLSKGGTNIDANLLPMCWDCHSQVHIWMRIDKKDPIFQIIQTSLRSFRFPSTEILLKSLEDIYPDITEKHLENQSKEFHLGIYEVCDEYAWTATENIYKILRQK